MTLHCMLHCPKGCEKHRFHRQHCFNACHAYVDDDLEEEEEEVEVDNWIDHLDLSDVYAHHHIWCDVCQKAIFGPFYHGRPELDYCQTCVREGKINPRACELYTQPCGYYDNPDGTYFFSTKANYQT